MKELLIKILVALNLASPTPKEVQTIEPSKELKVVEENTINYSQSYNDEWYGKAEYGKDFIKEITMKNEVGNVLKIKIDTWKDVYTMEYDKQNLPSDINVKYHYHNLQDLQDDIKLHQANINNNFKDWEELKEIDVVRKNEARDNDLRVRKQRVNQILRIDEIEGQGWAYLINDSNTWYTMTQSEINDTKEDRDTLIRELKMYNGFDIINNVDYELILGEDWKCLIHTEEGRSRVTKYLLEN